MNRRQRLSGRSTILPAAIASALALTQSVKADSPTLLGEREPASKADVRSGEGYSDTEIVLKFVEGSVIRHNGQSLVQLANMIRERERDTLDRSGVSPNDIASLLGDVKASLTAHGARTARLMDRSESELDAERHKGEAANSEELADLNLYYLVKVNPKNMTALVAALNDNPLVEIAYPSPLGMNAAAVDKSPTTPNYSMKQGYLYGSPYGVDAKFAWTLSGGTGSGVKIVDIEFDWHLTHEDLPDPFVTLRFPYSPVPDPGERYYYEHGTAVLGEMIGAKNSYGVTGIAHGASFGVSSVYGASNGTSYSVAAALNAAAGQLARGDIIVIEQQMTGPESTTTCDPLVECNCKQWKMIPPEYYQAEFDATKAATAVGIIVVAAAGNGNANLDAPAYNNKFKYSNRNSGAILVGAGYPGSLEPTCFTNYGSRLNAQGHGKYVSTTGYGDLTPLTGDLDQEYTTVFSGTSSATPIVAAAIAIYESRTGKVNAADVKTYFLSNGKTQPTPVTKAIGPLPDLRFVLGSYQPPGGGDFGAGWTPWGVSVWSQDRGGGMARDFSTAWTPVYDSQGVWGEYVEGSPSAFYKASSGDVFGFVINSAGKLAKSRAASGGSRWGGREKIGSANVAKPAGHVSVGNRNSSALSVFTFGQDGALKLYETSASAGLGGWTTSTLTSTNMAPPGAGVATTMRNGQIHTFFVGNDGAIKLIAYTLLGWSAVETISSTSIAPPGAPISVANVGGAVNVFVAGFGGSITQYWDATLFWGGPNQLTPTGTLPAGAMLDSTTYNATRGTVFYVDNDGVVRALTSVGDTTWTATAVTATDAAMPGAAVHGVRWGTGAEMDVFVNAHGGLAKSSTTNGTSWSTLTTLASPW